MKLIALLIVLILSSLAKPSKLPNIVLFLTDDQDIRLGGLTPMKKTNDLIAEHGVTFTNAFVSTPICCPSRSSILTGLYQHNHRTMLNSIAGGCNSPTWLHEHEPYTFAAHLKDAGYTTFYAGKYLNQYGKHGGTKHIPKGWDWWNALVGNSVYYNYDLSINGTRVHFRDKYLTNIIKTSGLSFLQTRNKSESFLMVLAPPAPHSPFTPEPKYVGFYNGTKAPRTRSFNIIAKKDKHWLVRMAPSPLPKFVVDNIDQIHASRWETLLTVDDLVADVFKRLADFGLLDETYIIFTSDHGYHLGQFSMAWDKRQPYEFDLRVPLLVRGPGIPKNKTVSSPILNIDIAPTLLSIAGVSTLHMDGRSFLPIRHNKPRTFLVEYSGEDGSLPPSDCPHLFNDTNVSHCTVRAGCKCQDAVNNTYICVRHLDLETRDTLYCKFYDDENFMESYNLVQDPDQVTNNYMSLTNATKHRYEVMLNKLLHCKGSMCDIDEETIHNYSIQAI